MPTRAYKTLRKWLHQELDPPTGSKVKHDDKVADYFGGDANAVIAFINVLNTNSKFTKDGLNLLPADVPPNPMVRQLLAAILDNYQDRGWTIS